MTLTLLNEWLAKQSQAMIEAKRKGLVPQSGDWEHPYRWIRPEDAKEIEVPEVPKSLIEIARDNQGKQAAEIEAMNLVSPQDITDGGYSNVIKRSDANDLVEPDFLNENGANDENLYERAIKLGLDRVTVWHGTTGKGATGILTDGAIHAAKTGGGFGAGFNMSPVAASHWSGGRQVGSEKKHLYDKLSVIIQFEIPVESLKDITLDQSSDSYTLKAMESTFSLDLGTTKILYSDDPDNPAPSAYFNLLGNKELSGVPKNLLKESAPAIEKAVSTESIASAKRRGLIPQSGDWMRPKRWIKPEDVKEIAISDTEYQMPTYDMSWDALVETELKDVDLVFHPIKDSDRTSSMFSDHIKDTDNFALSFLRYGQKIFFGESEEDIKEQILNEFISPEGRYFKSYYPPRLTPKPDWATDENDPFPEIPSDIKEIHYDDIPEFYKKNKYGDALQQFGSLKGISRKIFEVAGLHSEPFYQALKCVDGELDYEHAADVFSQELGENVTEKQAKLALNRLRDMTQKSLENRGLPEKFYVFRGGKIHNEDSPMPTSLSAATAAGSYFSQKGVSSPHVAMYEVSRNDVFLDMNSMKSEGQGEEELIILGRNLKNPRMIRLPNQMVDNPKFHKSKSLDKQAVEFRDFTSAPPDETVAARMKARGLEWKKETHRWVRPEDAEEEEQKIHELSGNRDEFFDALMKRFLDKRMSTEELTDAEKDFISHIKKAFDEDIDTTLGMLKELDIDTLQGASSIVSLLRERLRESFPVRKYYAQLQVNALQDIGDEVLLDRNSINNLVIRPYLLSQMDEFGNNVEEIVSNKENFSGDMEYVLGPINGFVRYASAAVDGSQPQDLVDLYIDGVLDISGRYDREILNASLINSIENFIDREELDKTLQFSRDNLFKFITSTDRIGVDSLISKVYDASSPKDKAFMRDSLLNSLKDEDLLSHIHMNFVSGGREGSNETKDVLAGINHLTLAIYEDMLKNGDIDDLAKFFSDENIPTGLLGLSEYSSLPFHFLSEHMSVDEFDSHIDTFLTGGEILRQTGIDALSYIDPNHPSLLAMVDTEENPYVISKLASSIPVTNLEAVRTQANKILNTIDLEKLQSDAWKEYAEKHGIDDEFLIGPDSEGYEEYREQRGKQIAHGEKAIALLRHSKADLEKTTFAVRDRLAIFGEVDFDMESVEAFQSLLKTGSKIDTTEQAYLPGMEPGEGEGSLDLSKVSFDGWSSNFSDDFVNLLEQDFSSDYDSNPGLPKLFDELYYGTLFGRIHELSKGDWEGSSSSEWGGILKESVGRQFDDKVIFHGDRRTRPSIDELLERERDRMFVPDKIKSAHFNQENLDTYVAIHKNLTRALLDVAVPNSDTIEVYRGTSANELDETDYSSLYNDSYEPASIESNSLSSYSMNEDTATSGFAESKDEGVVIHIPKLHKDNIWSTFLSHSYNGNEREILVIKHPDMDAYARSTEEPFDTDQFNPDFISLGSIHDIFGTGHSANEYVDGFGNASALADEIMSNIEQGYGSSAIDEYVASSKYDSYELQDWANNAAQQIMEDAKDEYEYTYDIPSEQEEAIEIVENLGFLQGILDTSYPVKIYAPKDILDNYPASEGYKKLSKNIFDKQKQLWEEGGETLLPVMDEGDEEELENEADRVAINLMEWAEQGEEKVSGI